MKVKILFCLQCDHVILPDWVWAVRLCNGCQHFLKLAEIEIEEVKA